MVESPLPGHDHEVLRAALNGDESGLARLFEEYRGRLRRMVEARLDDRLRGRIDASDVIQEAYADVAAGLRRYLDNPQVSFFLWVRYIAGVKLNNLHRHHLEYQKRDAHREVHPPHLRGVPEASSLHLAAAFIDDGPTPSEVAIRAEEGEQLEEALESMNPGDRELLAMRHLEQLENTEIAELLEISVNAVNVRYCRAAKCLRELVSRIRDSRSD
jgi:RNA polymerase sigma-70 factor (ECF subfamily)